MSFFIKIGIIYTVVAAAFIIRMDSELYKDTILDYCKDVLVQSSSTSDKTKYSGLIYPSAKLFKYNTVLIPWKKPQLTLS